MGDREKLAREVLAATLRSNGHPLSASSLRRGDEVPILRHALAAMLAFSDAEKVARLSEPSAICSEIAGQPQQRLTQCEAEDESSNSQSAGQPGQSLAQSEASDGVAPAGADLPTDKYGMTVLDRMRDTAENGTMPPEHRKDLFALLALAATPKAGLVDHIWKRACEGREGYCSSDLQDAARWAIGEAFRLSVNAAKSATLPSHYEWSEGNREKFDFGRDRAVEAVAALSTPTDATGAVRVADGTKDFELRWIAASRPPVHPNAMNGRLSFDSFERAVRFVSKQPEDSTFVSLHCVTTRRYDLTGEVCALLAASPTSPSRTELPQNVRQLPAIPAGMVPWHGGDSAPEDWDGGPVRYANGVFAMPLDNGDWQRPAEIPLVAYTPRAGDAK